VIAISVIELKSNESNLLATELTPVTAATIEPVGSKQNATITWNKRFSRDDYLQVTRANPRRSRLSRAERE